MLFEKDDCNNCEDWRNEFSDRAHAYCPDCGKLIIIRDPEKKAEEENEPPNLDTRIRNLLKESNIASFYFSMGIDSLKTLVDELSDDEVGEWFSFLFNPQHIRKEINYMYDVFHQDTKYDKELDTPEAKLNKLKNQIEWTEDHLDIIGIYMSPNLYQYDDKLQDHVLIRKFFVWKAGTTRTEIWDWFDEKYPEGLKKHFSGKK